LQSDVDKKCWSYSFRMEV